MVAMESLFPFIRDGVLLGISAALSPGPFQSLVIANSLVGGWRKAVPITFAPLIVDIPIAGVLIFVLSQVSESFLNAVRFAGAVMLLFLAWQLWGQIRSGGSSQESPNTESKENGSQRGGLFWGVIMLFLSPGPYLFWSLILGPLMLKALS
jgi:threonine/homoserine/homoserine lactone efflux protein